MKMRSPLWFAAAAVVATLVAARRDALSETREYPSPVAPPRTSAPPPAVPDPPALPAGADALLPLRFTVTTTWADAKGMRRTVQQVTRTRERVHLLMEGTRKEFMRARLQPKAGAVAPRLVRRCADVRRIPGNRPSVLMRYLERQRLWPEP